MWTVDTRYLINDQWITTRLSVGSNVVYLDDSLVLSVGRITKSLGRKDGWTYVVSCQLTHEYDSIAEEWGLTWVTGDYSPRNVHWSRIVAVSQICNSAFVRRGLSRGIVALVYTPTNGSFVDTISEFSDPAYYSASFKLTHYEERPRHRLWRWQLKGLYISPGSMDYPILPEHSTDLLEASANTVRARL